MRIHRDKLGTRVPGSLLGLGFVLIGAYSLLGGGDDIDAYTRDRAFWFGVTSVFAGACAIGASWLVGRLDNVWCAPPPRGWFARRRRG